MHISLALNTCFYMWNVYMCMLQVFLDMTMIFAGICILGPKYRPWICSWLHLDYAFSGRGHFITSMRCAWLVSQLCQGAESPGGARWWGAGWLWTLGLKCSKKMALWTRNRPRKLRGCKTCFFPFWEFTTWQVLMLSGSVICHQIGHLHKRNLIIDT